MSKYFNFKRQSPVYKEFVDATTKEPLEILGPIKKMNILIGANNSRKSRFMRKLLSIQPFLFLSKNTLDKNMKQLTSCIEDANETLQDSVITKFNLVQLKNINNINIHGFSNQIETLAKSTLPLTFQLDINYLKEIEKSIIRYCYYLLNYSPLNPTVSIPKKELINNYLLVLDCALHYGDEKIMLGNTIPWTSGINLHNVIKTNIENYKQHKPLLESIQKILLDIEAVEIIQEAPDKIYVPILRNAIRLYLNKDIINDSIYKDTISHNFGLEDNEELTIFTGLDFYHQIKKARNSRKTVRQNFSQFEDFVSKSFFQGKDIDIIALDDQSDDTNHILIYIDGDNDKKLHDLGDGIQALLILIYPIFMAKPNSWIFLEEPEINMHPGLLRLFIKTILENKAINDKNLQFLLTTHSNHLLNFILEAPDQVSIFSLKPSSNKDKNVSLVRLLTGANNGILDDLGVYNSSLFMANCSLWVEGPSDRKIIKAFLEAYKKSLPNNSNHPVYQEDLHYCFFQYGGSTLENYLLFENDDKDENDKIKAHFLSNKIILIADQDSVGQKAKSKQEVHKKIKTKARGSDNFKYLTTVVNEVENLLSPTILQQVINEILLKGNNQEYTEEFSYKEYKSINIGNFLHQKLDKYPTKSFTQNASKVDKKSEQRLKATYKKHIADYVLKAVRNNDISWSDIKEHPSARILIDKIYTAIHNYNSAS
jgi:hypothetical protein